LITCSKCRSSLAGAVFNTDTTFCPNCGVPTIAQVFPAYLSEPEKVKLEDTFLFEEEASCFYHPNKKAVTPCSACGRFLCSLCDVEIDNQHLCPVCIETGRRKRKIATLENHRTLYDRLALALVLAPTILFWPFVVFWPFTAITAIVVALWFWKAPSSILPRTRWRNILAIVLALVQIGVWTVFLIAIISDW
jgi:hypothetical protein